jgi:hypothetical protein
MASREGLEGIDGIPLGITLVIVGSVVMFWSFSLGLIITLVGAVIAGYASGRWS